MIAETQRARAFDPELKLPSEAHPPRFLHEIFESTVRRLPGQAAVEIPASGATPRRRLTYAEIDALANDLAARLAPFVTGESVVAILLPRRDHRVYVAQLAVLKAGAAYTCVEPGSPAEQARFILEDSKAVAAVVCPETRGRPAARRSPGPLPRGPSGSIRGRSATSSTPPAPRASPRG
jgi:non-ribosomal peptide synthetase component F